MEKVECLRKKILFFTLLQNEIPVIILISFSLPLQNILFQFFFFFSSNFHYVSFIILENNLLYRSCWLLFSLQSFCPFALKYFYATLRATYIHGIESHKILNNRSSFNFQFYNKIVFL